MTKLGAKDVQKRWTLAKKKKKKKQSNTAHVSGNEYVGWEAVVTILACIHVSYEMYFYIQALLVKRPKQDYTQGGGRSSFQRWAWFQWPKMMFAQKKQY